MKISLSRKDLISALSRINNVAERKSLVPALSDVLLEADTETLRLSATDLIVSVAITTKCDTKTPGKAAVPARDLLDRIKALPEGPIGLALDAKTLRLTITATGTPRKFTLATHDAEEFPQLPQASWKESSVIPSGKLRRLIGTVDHAMSGDITRPHLAGILVEWSEDTIRAVATDGHRMSLQEIAGTPSNGPARSVLIPSKGVATLSKALDGIAEPEEIVELEFVKDDIHIRTGDWTCAIKQTNAQFPPWQQVIPKSSASKAIVARASLIEAIRSVSLASSDANGGVTFKFSSDKLRLSAESSDKGTGVDELSCDFSGKEELSIGFNASYFTDALAAIDAEEVVIGLGGELDPAVVRANEKHPSATAVVMPVRL